MIDHCMHKRNLFGITWLFPLLEKSIGRSLIDYIVLVYTCEIVFAYNSLVCNPKHTK